MHLEKKIDKIGSYAIKIVVLKVQLIVGHSNKGGDKREFYIDQTTNLIRRDENEIF